MSINVIKIQKYSFKSTKNKTKKLLTNKEKRKGNEDDIPLLLAILTYFCYAVLIIFGYIRDALRKYGFEKRQLMCDKDTKDFVPLYSNFESFYTRNVYLRCRDALSQPICSTPGVKIKYLERVSHDENYTFQYTGKILEAINFGSYNYLGFAENSGICVDQVEEVISIHGMGICGSRKEIGISVIQEKLERLTAKFLGVEDAIVFPMGFATNSSNIPCIIGKGCLILSDKLNHASIALGCRLSGAVIKTFEHNDMKDLESKLGEYIVMGQPRSHRPWKKIMIMVEGVYSMEGTIVNLPEVMRLKRKYKAYLYLDEAHSIGALGPNGRGVADYYNIDPKEIDIMMGTFTKSFASAGGYIAGSKSLINHIKEHSHCVSYGVGMSAPIAQQIISSMEVIMGLDGTKDGVARIMNLKNNSKYLRRNLINMGFHVIGDDDSPVVPVYLYFPTKLSSFYREMLKRGIACVTVGFPATHIIGARVRFCLSAGHTKEMLDKCLKEIDEIGDLFSIKYKLQRSFMPINLWNKKNICD
ncbi:unnamed protein product [Gordionus sp. m RMFG-2023]|uniref:serine palmitoyltransferase 2-like n=1 Tax=Gordionus sp. m RMFG-2023 TaxID=3053472 RepID=UPI0030DF1613